MRVIAGVAGGRRLAVPPRGTRPTSDRVREALFAALEHDPGLAGATVLDLCAGSGALGLEALSRGAAHALFVESDRRAAAVLRRNVDAVGLPGAVVRVAPAATVLAGPAERAYDLLLVDPPYEVSGRRGRRLAGRGGRERLAGRRRAGRGRAVRPRPRRSTGRRRLRALRERRYGETVLHLGDRG